MTIGRAMLLMVCLVSASCQRAPQGAIAPVATVPKGNALIDELPGISLGGNERADKSALAAIEVEDPTKIIHWPDDLTPLHGEHFLSPPPERGIRISSGDESDAIYSWQLRSEDRATRLRATQKLWELRSQKHAEAVIQFAAQLTPENQAERSFQQSIERETATAAILSDLKSDDYRTYKWAVRLAQIKADNELVPALIASLEKHPYQQDLTVLALGKTGDVRALRPLVAILLSDTYYTSALAARALGDLGLPMAEPYLLEALERKAHWGIKVGSCEALGKLGSSRALPALEELAKLKDTKGEAGLIGAAAAAAMTQIRERNK